MRTLTIETEAQRVSQEQMLQKFLEQSGRFGDLVNSKISVESLGKGFGLTRVWVCRDGQDVIGGLVPQRCPSLGRSYFVKMLGQDLEVHFDWANSAGLSSHLLIKAIFISSAISLVLFLLISALTYNYLITKVGGLSRKIAQMCGPNFQIDCEIPEFEPIVGSISRLYLRIEQNNMDLGRLRTSEAIAKLSRQVAHDIRSPLSALRIFSAKVSAAPDLLDLVSTAIARIEGIAKDLLVVDSTIAESETFVVSREFFDIVSAFKRAESKCFIDVEARIEPNVIVRLSETVFSRVLSNVLNNSIEAGAKNVRLLVLTEETRLAVAIEDDGSGIPADILGKLGGSPISAGKVDGLGLGLFYLFNEVRRAGGEVTISNKLPTGTEVRFWLPRESVKGFV